MAKQILASGIIPPLKLKEGVLYHLETGLVYRLVCAPADWDAEKVQTETNLKGTPGTTANEWVIKPSTAEEPNGGTCDQDPTRKHWLLVC